MKRTIAGVFSALTSSWNGPHVEGEFNVGFAAGNVKSSAEDPAVLNLKSG
jgi:hypothetical protein